MKLVMLPVIVSIGAVLFAQRDKMMDLYHAAYPGDPMKAEALRVCAQIPNFNRLDSGDRAACYTGTFGKAEAAALPDPPVPAPQPHHPYSLAHLSDKRHPPPGDALQLSAWGNTPHPIVHPILPHHPYRPHHDTHAHIQTGTLTATQQ